MKIVILDGYTLNPGDLSWNAFEKLGSLTVYDRTASEEIVSRIGDAEIVITNKIPINADTLKKCNNIRYIGVLATGYNVVDVVAAKQKSIVVTNIPTYGTAAVAQFVFALLLEICHNVGSHANSVAKGDWGKKSDFCYWNSPLIELKEKTMGIIGYGRIGRSVAEIARAFGMNVLACDTFPIDGCVDMDMVLSNSDIISLHCPLFDSNKGFINKETIAKMKDGVILINTSRGPLINEADLAQALNSGKVYAAGLDVLSCEPPKVDNPVIGAKNCYVTPHIAWAPKEARTRLMNIAIENLQEFINGNPINTVN